MSEDNLRHQAVKSLMLAIDLEHGDKDLEAYLKYLEGLSLVVTALQKDATNGDKWLFTDKIRRSMVNFAKESIDRIVLLLKKQDKIAEKKHEGVVPNNILKTSYQDISAVTPGKADDRSSNNYNKEPKETVHEKFDSHCSNDPTVYETFESCYINAQEEITLGVDLPLSPLEAVRLENTQLSKKYAHRLLNAPSIQKPQLRLELERRIAENMAIAENKQLAWDVERERAVQHYSYVAQQKCRYQQKSKDNTQEDIDVNLQDAIYSCLMFEWERKLRTINGTMEVYPKVAKSSSPELMRHVSRKAIDMATKALMGSIRGHPLGSLLVRKQQSVCNEISMLLGSHDASDASSKEVHVFLDSIVKESTGPMCMFNRIAGKIKRDLEFLETILVSLYEPLNTDEGQLLVSHTLQKIYFPAITPSIKALLRLCIHSYSTDVESEQERLRGSPRMEVSSKNICVHSAHNIENSSEMEARFRLQSLQSFSSPCEKLDCLTEVMRSLCSWKFDCTTDAKKDSLQPIGADDLLSRLVAVIHGGEEGGQNSLAHLLRMEAIFLEAFLTDGIVLGEAGYCVTVLCGALSIEDHN